jgi:hypothetical protein
VRTERRNNVPQDHDVEIFPFHQIFTALTPVDFSVPTQSRSHSPTTHARYLNHQILNKFSLRIIYYAEFRNGKRSDECCIKYQRTCSYNMKYTRVFLFSNFVGS